MERRRKFGTPRRRVALLLAAAAAVTGMALPAGAQAQGQGKKILIYTGTTGFRHTDGINGGRPIIQSRLEGLGYTVAWEDCSSRATLEINLRPTHCNHPNQNPRVFTSANLAQYDAIVFLNSSWSWGGGGDAATGPLLEGSQKDALVGYLQNGGGIAAIHNMTDAAAGGSAWDWWDGSPNSVIGTTMPGHAATNATGNAATVQVADNNHLSTKDLPDTWTIADEHYNYLRNVRGGHHVLATSTSARTRRASTASARTTRSPGASSTTAPTSTTARRRRSRTPTAARGTPAWATSVCATPRTAATTTWST